MEDVELEASIAAIQHPRHRAWLNAFLSDPDRNGTEACRVAGYESQGTSLHNRAARLRRRYSQIIAAYDVRTANAGIIGPREAQELVAEIARDREITPRDRLKAIELVLRIHGMLTDAIKLDGNVNIRQAIMSAVGSGLTVRTLAPGEVIAELAVPEPELAD